MGVLVYGFEVGIFCGSWCGSSGGSIMWVLGWDFWEG